MPSRASVGVSDRERFAARIRRGLAKVAWQMAFSLMSSIMLFVASVVLAVKYHSRAEILSIAIMVATFSMAVIGIVLLAPALKYIFDSRFRDRQENSLPRVIENHYPPFVPPGDCYKLVLVAADPQSLEGRFDRETYRHLFDLVEGRPTAPRAPYLVRFTDESAEPHQGYCLVMKNMVFYASFEVSRSQEEQHNDNRSLWITLKPQFPDGMKPVFHSECLPSVEHSPDGTHGFPDSIRYPTVYVNPGRSFFMNAMFGLRTHIHDDGRFIEFSRNMLASYIAYQRGLLEECVKNSQGDPMWVSDPVAKFVCSIEGRGFVGDLLEHRSEFYNIAVGSSIVYASEEDRQFLARAISAVEERLREVPETQTCDATPSFILAPLYGMTSPYYSVVHYNLNPEHEDFFLAQQQVLRHFIADDDFRAALVCQTMLWVLSVMPRVHEWDEEFINTILSRARNPEPDEVHALPTECSALPDLLRSVLCVMQAFGGGGATLSRTFGDHFTRPMHLIPGFQDCEVPVEDAGYAERFVKLNQNLRDATGNAPHVHYLIVGLALSFARELNDDVISQGLHSYFESYEYRHNKHPEFSERVRSAFQIIDAVGDGDVMRELIAYGVADTIRASLLGKKCSVDELKNIAASANNRVGALLAKDVDMEYALISRDVGRRRPESVDCYATTNVINILPSNGLRSLFGIGEQEQWNPLSVDENPSASLELAEDDIQPFRHLNNEAGEHGGYGAPA
ncbi:MAG: hypothetical protein ACTJLL_02025 [Anaplasma sp.]